MDIINHYLEWDQYPEESMEFGGDDKDSLYKKNKLDDRESD
jgi:hypothetical protein